MRYIYLILFFPLLAFSSIYDKSAIIYYEEDISYPTMGIHDYIIIQPNHVDPNTQGFQIYKDKIYAYVSIGELDRDLTIHKYIKKEWIATKNKMWNSDVLDIKNKAYQEFIFTKQIDPLIKKGFQNFFFDTLDSYYLYSKTPQQQQASRKALAAFINEFHKRYPNAKLIINRGFDIIDEVHDSITAVLFESYYNGIGSGKNPYKEVSDDDRAWLDSKLAKIKAYHKDIISVEYLPTNEVFSKKADTIIKKILAKGMIPYISNKDLSMYGNSSKVAIKREIFTLIDESNLDRTLQESHQLGATVLEYFGYKEKFHDIRDGLPPIEDMLHYKGVLIWLQASSYSENTKLFSWIYNLVKNDIKVVFISGFSAANTASSYLQPLGITLTDTSSKKIKVLYQDPTVGFESSPPMASESILVHPHSGKKLLTFLYSNGKTSTPVAIMPWGGYMVYDGYITNIDSQNLWVVNPFSFFQQALDLQKLPIADVTTKTGKRLLFTHVDGDGLGNQVEGSFGKYSGDVILNHIVRQYKIPHSISIIGAEVDPNGLFPQDYQELRKIVKEIYSYPYVEGASHTYTHPFFWGKIKNGNLDPKYRLKVKGYKFSFQKEFVDTLKEINTEFYPKGKTPKADDIFWSGDCIPRVNALSFIAKHHIKAINGGDTTITYQNPWLSLIAPLGVQRKNYVQIYTGAQNENVFTNDWLGPFWGFKQVVQTFKLTNSPRRFKPIDIYYHLYSGSKKASLNALRYVFDWAIKQDVHPIFTSEYIPMVEEFYNYSIAKDEDGSYLISGLDAIQTLRVEDGISGVDFAKTPSAIGIKHFQNHTYISLLKKKNHIIKLDSSKNYQNDSYLISANGDVISYKKQNHKKHYKFKGYVPLQFDFHLPKGCSIDLKPSPFSKQQTNSTFIAQYKEAKEAEVWISCDN